jgi:hypothetical protein
MIRFGGLTLLLSAGLLLAGCVHHSEPLALPEPSGNVLSDTAALLAMADSARNAEQRAPLLERLNALNVRLAEGASDDPLSGWRNANPTSTAAPWRGRTLGPAYRRAQVGAGESLRIEQVFYAGQRAEIAAQTSSGGQVELKIANPRAQAVCAQQLSPRGTCNFLPIYTERFSIELENTGNSSASVYIVFR